MNHDLVQPGLDFSRAAIDLATSSDPTQRVAYDLARWLGLTSTPESDFNLFIEKSRALFRPNKTGLLLRHRIIDAEAQYKNIGSLQLVSSCSLGQHLALSEDHYWIVSTIASCLIDCTSDDVEEILLRIIYYDINLYKADASSVLGVKKVISKLVDNITVNIANSGLTYGYLPSPLSELCNHIMPPDSFALLVMEVQRSNRLNTIRTKRFYGNLTLWLLGHFHGTITISLAGKEIYSSCLCDCTRSLIMVIENICGCRYKTYSKTASSFIEQSQAGEMCDALLAVISSMSKKPPRTWRAPLYDIPSTIMSGEFRKKDEARIVDMACRFWRWLMNARVRPRLDPTVCIFELVSTSTRAPDDTIKFQDLFFRTPAILRDKPGEFSSSDVKVFTPRIGVPVVQQIGDPRVRVCKSFPDFSDLLESFRGYCKCRWCRTDGAIDILPRECIRTHAFELLLFHILHAIADAFGVEDWSPFSRSDQTRIYPTMDVMVDLAAGTVAWSRWFTLASSTALGHSPSAVANAIRNSDTSFGVAAVQFGAQIAVAPWFDITQPIRLNQLFALKVCQGKLVDVDSYVVFLSRAGSPAINAAAERSNQTEVLSMTRIPDDTGHLTVKNLLLEDEDYTCRITTLYQIGLMARKIDPTQVMCGCLRSIRSTCRCDTPHNVSLESAIPSALVHTFEDVLASWSEIKNVNPESTYVTLTLSTHSQLNAALCLSLMGSVILEQDGCLRCCAKDVDRLPRTSRRVISVTKDLFTRSDTWQSSENSPAVSAPQT